MYQPPIVLFIVLEADELNQTSARPSGIRRLAEISTCFYRLEKRADLVAYLIKRSTELGQSWLSRFPLELWADRLGTFDI